MVLDQEQLVEIFTRLKSILKEFEDPLAPKLDLDSKYDLWSFKDIEIDGENGKKFTLPDHHPELLRWILLHAGVY